MTNSKLTKRALLSSLMALILCFTMLLGTTFAWFTDTASTSVNKIEAGNLDIEVYYATPSDLVDGSVPDANWKVISADESIFREGALWEPGYTEIVYLKFVNKGSLALKYQLRVNIVNEVIGKNKAGGDIKLSDYIQSYAATFFAGQPEFFFSDRDVATKLTGITGAPDVYYDTLYNSTNCGIGSPTENVLSLSHEYYLDETDSTTYTTLVLWLPETVSNEANHDGINVPSIDLGINVVATQNTYEKDSFNNEYDKDAEYPVVVSTSTGLKNAISHISDGDNIVLADNIAYNEQIVINNEDITLDLDGHTLSKGPAWYADPNDAENVVLSPISVKGGSLTITGQGTIQPDDGYAVDVHNGAVVTIEDGTFVGNIETIYVSSGTVYIKGGTFSMTQTRDNYANPYGYMLHCGSAGYAAGTAKIIVTGGTFANFNPANNPSQTAGTNFVADGYTVESRTDSDGTIWYTVVPE